MNTIKIIFLCLRSVGHSIMATIDEDTRYKTLHIKYIEGRGKVYNIYTARKKRRI